MEAKSLALARRILGVCSPFVRWPCRVSVAMAIARAMSVRFLDNRIGVIDAIGVQECAQTLDRLCFWLVRRFNSLLDVNFRIWIRSPFEQ
jgi:hypothetical protein